MNWSRAGRELSIFSPAPELQPWCSLKLLAIGDSGMEKPKRAKSPEIKVWFGEQRYHIGGGSWGTEAVSWIGMKQRLEEFGGFGRGDLAWLKDDWGDRLSSPRACQWPGAGGGRDGRDANAPGFD